MSGLIGLGFGGGGLLSKVGLFLFAILWVNVGDATGPTLTLGGLIGLGFWGAGFLSKTGLYFLGVVLSLVGVCDGAGKPDKRRSKTPYSSTGYSVVISACKRKRREP